MYNGFISLRWFYLFFLNYTRCWFIFTNKTSVTWTLCSVFTWFHILFSTISQWNYRNFTTVKRCMIHFTRNTELSNLYKGRLYQLRTIIKQESILVGCVPTVAVACTRGVGVVTPRYPTPSPRIPYPLEGTWDHRSPSNHHEQTNACENITFPCGRQQECISVECQPLACRQMWTGRQTRLQNYLPATSMACGKYYLPINSALKVQFPLFRSDSQSKVRYRCLRVCASREWWESR